MELSRQRDGFHFNRHININKIKQHDHEKKYMAWASAWCRFDSSRGFAVGMPENGQAGFG
jgi:hypothetical protein